jgi:hypothetical protein
LEATAAFRAVLDADKVNMEQERRDEHIPEYHEVGGSFTIDNRRAFFLQLGEQLSDFPEAKMRVGKIAGARTLPAVR